MTISIYPCLKTLGISYTIYCKGIKLASKVELLNIFNLNNEDDKLFRGEGEKKMKNTGDDMVFLKFCPG